MLGGIPKGEIRGSIKPKDDMTTLNYWVVKLLTNGIDPKTKLAKNTDR